MLNNNVCYSKKLSAFVQEAAEAGEALKPDRTYELAWVIVPLGEKMDGPANAAVRLHLHGKKVASAQYEQYYRPVDARGEYDTPFIGMCSPEHGAGHDTALNGLSVDESIVEEAFSALPEKLQKRHLESTLGDDEVTFETAEGPYTLGVSDRHRLAEDAIEQLLSKVAGQWGREFASSVHSACFLLDYAQECISAWVERYDGDELRCPYPTGSPDGFSGGTFDQDDLGRMSRKELEAWIRCGVIHYVWDEIRRFGKDEGVHVPQEPEEVFPDINPWADESALVH